MTSGELAEWLSAAGTVAAVAWGVWQVRQDRRREQREQQEAIHEIASVAERVARRWDEYATVLKSGTTSASIESMRSQRYTFFELQETLDRLLQRQDLTDGTVRCGVGARQLACRIVEELIRAESVDSSTSTLRVEILALKERAQRALDKSRNLRRSHSIPPPRKPRLYAILKPPPTQEVSTR
jgi:hypothetical protein